MEEERPHRNQVVDARNADHTYTPTLASRTSALPILIPESRQIVVDCILVLASAFSSVSSSDQPPGSAGTETLMPSSVLWRTTW